MKQELTGGRAVSRETTERLEVYVSLLLRWNRTINLISRRDEADIWSRHIIDSLALAELLPANFAFALDLGSGGGFPGLVLAIATGSTFHLVESDVRKAIFLREAGRETGAAIIVHAERIEACQVRDAPVVTARALAPLPRLLAWAFPLLASDGMCIFPKGRGHTAELTAAASEWHMHVDSFQSATDPAAANLRIRDIQRVGPKLGS